MTFKSNRKHVSKTILEICPDFCWVTSLDLLMMLEQIPYYEDVTMECFQALLSKLKSDGCFYVKRDIAIPRLYQGPPKLLYLKK